MSNCKKAFFFDIDGTLCYENDKGLIIPESTVNAIDKLIQKGYKVFVATGRPEIFIPDYILNYNHNGVICANGSVVKVNGEIIYEKRVPNTFIKDLFSFCDENNYVYMLEGDKAYIKDRNNEIFKNFYSKVHFPNDMLKEGYDLNTGITYNISIIGDVDESKVFEFFGEKFLFAKQNFAKFIDIYYKDSTKADGMNRIIEHLKLDDYETYAFGDGGNDIQMILRADFGIAMGNARDELKEISDYITTDVDKDGISNALKYYNLID